MTCETDPAGDGGKFHWVDTPRSLFVLSSDRYFLRIHKILAAVQGTRDTTMHKTDEILALMLFIF